MVKKRIDPRQQFSKWLARSSALFLVFYLTALLVLMYFRPETATSCIYLAIIVSVIRIFDAGFYTKNSLTEKLLLTMLDKARLKLEVPSLPTNIAISDENGGIDEENGEIESESEDG